MFKWLSKYFASPSELYKAGILGMNSRNFKFIAKYNKRRRYPLVDDKVQTKALAQKFGITTPRLIGTIEYQHEVAHFQEMVKDWKSFVIKPAHGSGGKGVLVISSHDDEHYFTPSGRMLAYKDIYQHLSNTLSGLYSLGGQYDTAVLEEMVNFSHIFDEYSYQGIPDVRLIIYRGYPVMAMTRLATAASGGRANLHQGAVGVGLDIKTGKTLKAVMRNMPITHHPDTHADLSKIEVPFWKEHLIIGAKAYEMTRLGYLGADIVLDADKGPMMLELNARPGLAVQIANGIGLRKVLKRVDKYFPKRLSPEERVDFLLNYDGK